jgi:hypothetical protein
MSDLAAFLLARLADDEAAANYLVDARAEWAGWTEAWEGAYGPLTRDDLPDPARVLADVAAKRAIVEWAIDADGTERTACENAGWDSSQFDTAGAEILRHLAQPFASHPDFDPAWAVTS